MSGFGDNFDQNEVDPAAEFLAREQDELAGLEDEIKPAAASAPVANGDDPINSAGSFEMIEGADQENQIKTEMNDELCFDSDPFATGINLNPGAPDLNRATPSPPQVREEPEKIRLWREEQAKRLEEKDREEEKKKQELREIARKELEDWYKNHEEAIAKTKAANREAAKNAEKQFVAEDDEIQPGTEWERIAKLCDFNPKAKQGSKDVSRMRSIILQMKQSPVAVNKA